MLTAEEYRKRSRKTITIPSGGEVTVRKLEPWDYLPSGEIPLAFQEAMAAKDVKKAEVILAKDINVIKGIKTAAIVSGVVSMNIVDKDPKLCGEDEISVHELDREDSKAIFEAIMSFNNMTTEAGKSLRRFPEESGSSGDGGSDGEAVREDAIGDITHAG